MANEDTFCTANVGTASSDGYIACAADKSAPLHNPHDVEHFQHEYRSDYPHRTVATEGEAKRIAVVQACTALGMTICGVCNKQTAQLEEGGWVSTLCDCALAEIEHLRGELHIVAKFLRDCGYSSTKEGEQIEELYQRIRKYEVC